MSAPPAESGLTAERPAPDGSEQRMDRTALEETKIALGGMTCGHCVETVEGALRSVAGVREASADLPTQTAVVKFDPSTAAVPAMESAVAAAGYAPRRSDGLVSLDPNPRFEPPATAAKPSPEPEEHLLAIDGMTCASCVRSVEQASESVPGVSACEVNLADRTARVWIEPNRAAVRDVVSAIRASGYGARIAHARNRPTPTGPRSSLRRRLTVSAALTAPLLVLAMADGMLQFPGSVWVQFGLALPVVVYGGAPFYSAAWLAARHGRVDMNTLIAMGTGAAFLYSIVATVAPELVSASAGGVYYETAAAILTLVLLGRVLESRASRRTSASIRKLLALQAKSVHVRREGVESEIPLERVVVGDEVVVRPGERIPVDGTVVEGEGAVDESHVTGESVPSDKRRGSRVTSGSLNQNGFLVFRAESVGSDTALSRIIDFVRRAQGSKAPAAKLADRIAAVFVPIVFGIATLTFVVWMVAGPPEDRLRSAWTSAVSVLIIACPCAVGLATPAALAVAIGRAAESGILIRDGAALEAAENVDTVVFDKTGTLTQGRLRVTDAVAFGSMASEELLRIAGGIERHSEHPVAKAIAEARPGFGGAISEFRALPGAGASARVDGEEWLLGKRELLTRSRCGHISGPAGARRVQQAGKDRCSGGPRRPARGRDRLARHGPRGFGGGRHGPEGAGKKGSDDQRRQRTGGQGSRVGSRHWRGHRACQATRQVQGHRAASIHGADSSHGRGRDQRCSRPDAGGRGNRNRGRDRHCDRVRTDRAGSERPVRRRQGHRTLPKNAKHHPPELLVGVWIQRAGGSGGSGNPLSVDRHAAVADPGIRSDGVLEPFGHIQQPAPQPGHRAPTSRVNWTLRRSATTPLRTSRPVLEENPESRQMSIPGP